MNPRQDHRPTWRSRPIVALLVAVAVGACSSPATPSSAPAPAATDPAGAASQSPVASPPILTPWQEEVGNLEPDGRRSVESALALFAAAFGPIPGVVAEPADPGTVGSASPAVRAVMAHRDRLTDEQRAAIDGYLAVSDDSRTIEIPAGGGTAFASRAGFLALAGTTAAQDGYDADERDLQRLGIHARRAAARYFGEIPDRPDGSPAVSIRTTSAGSEPFLTFFNPTFGPGGFERCDVHVNRAHATEDRGLTMSSLMLDVIHCYQSWRMGSEQGFDGNVPAWAWEGPAQYIKLEAVPLRPEDYAQWARYVERPDIPLFERSYDAIGVYAQAREAGVDLSSAFVEVLADVDNPERFALAGMSSNAVLDKWASELLRSGRGDWGPDWDFDGPRLDSPDLRAPEQRLGVANGSVEAFSQSAYSNHLFVIDATADIVRVTAFGRIRVADGTYDSVITGDADFCITTKGCGPCPDGSGPTIQPTPLTSISVLAVSGGTDGSNGAISGHLLEEFCEDEEDEFCAAYRAILHWWFREATDVGSPAWAAELADRFTELRPLAPTMELGAAVEVHIGLYTAYATLTGPQAVRAAVPFAQRMEEAVDRLDAYCAITLADRGG